jgi:transposase
MMGDWSGIKNSCFIRSALTRWYLTITRCARLQLCSICRGVYGELSPHYPALGRRSIDPVLMIRMLIPGYAFGLRSERLLCREVKVNLAYRWFCGLSIEDKIPDHSAFSRARNEQFRDNDIFRRVFERVVEACISAGLVSGKEFAVDASLIVADANKQRSIPGAEWIKERNPETASRAVKEYMATLDDAAFGAAICYFVGGGALGKADNIRIFNFPPSET